jgi:glutamate-5-semialdehyde dehydrogenase
MVRELGCLARTAAQELAKVSSDQKNQVLTDLAEMLWIERSFILANNDLDVDATQKSGLSAAMVDRLTLNADRLRGIAAAR